MNARRSNPRAATGSQARPNEALRPTSRKGEGRRSAHKAGAAAVNRPKPGKAQQEQQGRQGRSPLT